MNLRNLRRIEDLEPSDYLSIFRNSEILREQHEAGVDCTSILKGKVVTCIFSGESIRTKAMIQAAVHRLGGVFSYENITDQSYCSKGEESLIETVFSYSQFSDILIIRHDSLDLMTLGPFVNSPLINALSGPHEHSLAAIGRAYSINRRCGNLSEVVIGIYGSILISRPLKSLVKLLSLFGATIYNDSVIPELKLTGEILDIINSNGSKVIESSINNFIGKIDALFVAEGLPQNIYNEATISSYCENFKSISLDLINNMKKNSLFSVGMPNRLPNKRSTILPEVQQIFMEEKRNIFIDWVYCTQALICHLLGLSVSIKSESTKG